MKYFLLVLLGLAVLLVACSPSYDCSDLTEFECTTINAVVSNNVEACANTEPKELCESFVAVGTNNKELCNGLTGNEKANCVLGISYNNHDFQYCYAHDYALRLFSKEFDTTDRFETCNALIVSQHPARELCESVPEDVEGAEETEWPDFCYYWMGRQTQNDELCKLINDEALKLGCSFQIAQCREGDVCQLGFAKRQKNTEFCNAIIDKNMKELCFYEISQYTDNITGCEFAGQKKLSCLVMLEGRT